MADGMREHKQSDSPCGYTRDVYRQRLHDGSLTAMPPANLTDPITRSSILTDFAQTWTELDDKNVRLAGAAISLQDPRDIANQIEQLAQLLTGTLRFGDGGTAEGLANAIAAQCGAFRLARARVEELDPTSGEAA